MRNPRTEMCWSDEPEGEVVQVTLTAIHNRIDPAAGRRISTREIADSTTVAELIAAVDIPDHLRDLCEIRFNGHPCLTPETTILQPDSQVVLVPPLCDGDDGGKDIIRGVAAIAIMVAAIATQQHMIAVGVSKWLAAGTAVAITATGNLLVNSMLPLPTPALPQISGLSPESGLEGSSAYAFTAPRTSWTPGLPIPVLYGKFPLAGQVINQYIVTNNNTSDQTIKILLAMCWGPVETPVSSADDIRLNNSMKLSDMDSYSFATTQGTSDQACLGGHERIHDYRPLSIKLSNRTVLLLRGDVFPFVDDSPFNHTITNSGGISLDTSNKKYGAGSTNHTASVNGLAVTGNKVLDLSTQDWTITCHIMPTAGNGIYILLANFNGLGWGWKFYYNESTDRIYFYNTELLGPARSHFSAPLNATYGIDVFDGEFHSVAMSRQGDRWAIWCGTTRVGSGANLDYTILHNSPWTINVGAAYNIPLDDFLGRIDEMRLHTGTVLYDPDLATIEPLAQVSEDFGQIVATRGECDRMIVHVSLPGLYKVSGSTLADHDVDFSIHYRAEGDSTWKLRQGIFYFTSGSDAPTAGDEIEDSVTGATGIYDSVVLTSGSWAGNDAAGYMIIQDVVGEFSTSNTLDNNTAVLTNIATTHSTASYIRHFERITSNTRNAVRRQYEIAGLTRGKHQTMVTRISAEETSTEYMSDLYLSGLDEIIDVELRYPLISLLSLSIQASESLQSLSDVTAITDRGNITVPNYTGIGTRSVKSSTVAMAEFDRMTNTIYGHAMDPALIDSASWGEWETWGDELVEGVRRFEVNGVFDSPGTAGSARTKLEQLGRAKIIQTGRKTRVVMEKPVVAPSTMFSPGGNIHPDSDNLKFISRHNRPDKYFIEYKDAARSYDSTLLPVLSSGFDSLTREPVVEKIFLWGCTDESQARRFGLLRMQMSDILNRLMTWSSNIDALDCLAGDVVRIPSSGNALVQTGRLARQSGLPINKVKLDKVVHLDAATYSGNCTLWIRLADNDLVEVAVTGPWDTDTNVLDLAAGIADKAVFNIYNIGRSTGEVMLFRLIHFTKSANNDFKLSALEYNEAIYFHASVGAGLVAI